MPSSSMRRPSAFSFSTKASSMSQASSILPAASRSTSISTPNMADETDSHFSLSFINASEACLWARTMRMASSGFFSMKSRRMSMPLLMSPMLSP